MYGTKPDDYYRLRSGLKNTARALENGRLTIGFLGGSITEPRSARWSDKLVDWLQGRFPGVVIDVENAAIGATGSTHGILRAERDIISRGCDLILMEYAVNDKEVEPHMRQCTREGLLRKILRGTDADVIMTHTFCMEFFADLKRGVRPSTIGDFEALAEHYGVSSVFMYEYAMDEVRRGTMRWDEWLPDGLHASNVGAEAYARPVAALIERALTEDSRSRTMPEPICPDNWENCQPLDLKKVRRSGAWRLEREQALALAEYNLHTSAPEARLEYDFEGTGSYLIEDFGVLTCDFRWRVDGGEWNDVTQEIPWWVKSDKGWQRTVFMASGLKKGHHVMEIETVMPERTDAKGCRFEVLYIGVLAD